MNRISFSFALFCALAFLSLPAAAQDMTQDVPVEAVEAETLLAPPQQQEGENRVVEGDIQAPIRLTPDKTGLVQLSRNAVNVVVGNLNTLRIIPDTNRSLVLVPKEPGATFFRAIDENGEVIMQRYVIVAAPEKEYIRVRRSCNTRTNAQPGSTCREYSVYYCPDMCHEVSVTTRDAGAVVNELPEQAASSRNTNATSDISNPDAVTNDGAE